nr:hypothetical protein [Pseudomonas fluorescens]
MHRPEIDKFIGALTRHLGLRCGQLPLTPGVSEDYEFRSGRCVTTLQL